MCTKKDIWAEIIYIEIQVEFRAILRLCINGHGQALRIHCNRCKRMRYDQTPILVPSMMARPCYQMRVGCRRGVLVRIWGRRSQMWLCEFLSVCSTARYHNLYPTSQSIVHLEIVQAIGLISLSVCHESINTVDSNHISIAVLSPALGRKVYF